MVIVFSGLKDPELEKQIELAEGKVTENIKQATHILVKKRGDKPTKKQQEAEARGIDVLNYAEFIEEHGFDKKTRATKKPAAAKKTEPASDNVIDMLNKIIHSMATGDDKDDALAAIDEIRNMISK
jgi:hypothetical protein